ncbi:FecCD family ABC transporter permease [Microbacterium karelineae]|uniref:FecCD family ABC transporter permease n=1 Tax=Microbacterium karelineae TaxID=2654283 RepID=UPI0012EA8F67|nr:iron ABC transporter permease [Microbacterium karelineae]
MSAVAATRRRARRVAPFVVLGAIAGLVIFGLVDGSQRIPAPDALLAAVGLGDGGSTFIVQQLRMPRVVVAAVAGACLGAAGALMQGLMRNPLASPDILGVTGGASLAAVVAIGAGIPPAWLPFAAATGAIVAVAIIQSLARRTGAGGARLVLVGIGVHAIAGAVTTLVVARIDPQRLGAAEVWLAGSLHARDAAHVTIALLGAAVLVPLAFALLRGLAVIELGDEIAIGAGVAVPHTRALVLIASALLAGVAVAVTGPLGFVALGAPHIARRLVGPTSAPMLAMSMLVGALLVLAADALGQRLLDDAAIPAGVVTAALGAPYLLWLLHRTGRR